MKSSASSLSLMLCLLIASALPLAVRAQPPARARAHPLAVSGASSVEELRAADALIERFVRSGDLRLVDEREDALVPGRMHQRFQQIHRGVPVLQGEVVRQLQRGQLVSAFGRLFDGIAIDVQPTLSRDAVRDTLRAHGFTERGAGPAELVVLPRRDGSFGVGYRLRAAGASGPRTLVVDSADGSIVANLSRRQTQNAQIGQGVGVLGDSKKVSTTRQGGTFVTSDRLRPPQLETYDMRGDLDRTLAFLRGEFDLGPSDLGAKSDNVWTDGAVVDAHVYQGWVYDYYYKRFQRRGLDNNNVRVRGLVHPASLRDFFSAPSDMIGLFYMNAFFDEDCMCMVYGEGLPSGIALNGLGLFVNVNNFAAALDVVAHELTHAVTASSSRLTYSNESGALNEAFSDIIGTSIEFFYQRPGTAAMQADYMMGEDLVTSPVTGFVRSMATPRRFGDPDHYAGRACIGNDECDSGGVHTNSTIASHAFYLAIEGGTNPTSGRAVEGVGAANREQIEKVFYRAFTAMLPANATFYLARLATIQSARDLYGSGSAAERAVSEAWDAVGVTSPGAALTTTHQPKTVPASMLSCDGRPGRSFAFRTTVTEFQNVGFTMRGFDVNFFDARGRYLSSQSFNAADFGRMFGACGGGSAHVDAGAQACAASCIQLGGRSSGYATFTFLGSDDNGNDGVFDSVGVTLGLGASADVGEAVGAPSFSVRSQQ